MQATIAARVQSAKIITRLRLMRSLMIPAAGETKNCGRTCSTNASATDFAEPVNCSSRLNTATVYSQSPSSLMICADHSSRKFRFPRSSRT